MSDLIERLRQLASNTGKMTWVNDLPMPATAVLHLAADEIEHLTAEVRRLDHSTTHTCWDECPRLACAQRREIEALTAQLAEARESERAAVDCARQEGWNAAIEAAAAHLERDDGYGEWWEAAATIRALAMPDPVRDTLADSDGDDGA